MKRVLIIGPDFHYFNNSIAKAFKELGWEVMVESYTTPVHPYTLLAKICYKYARNKLKLRQKSRLKYDSYIRAQFNAFHPDLVFVLNGDNLSAKTVAYFHKYSKVVFWLYDSISRMMHTIDNLRVVDFVYCYEQQDIALLAMHQITASFLPQAVDPTLYFPIEDVEKKYDIVFAGEIWNSPKRQRLLEIAIAHFPDKRFRIIGRYKIPTKDFFGWLFRKHRDIFTNNNASAEELNRLYNEARVVLNIHNEQQLDGANPKVYEILASGAYEICDSNPFIEKEFGHCPHMLLYRDEKELLAKIRQELETTHSPKLIDISQYTFQSRIQKVLTDLQK